MPVTYAWRDELEKKTQNALHRALGNIPPASRGGMMSRSSQRGPSQFDGLEDGKVSITIHTTYMQYDTIMYDSFVPISWQILNLLCRILQTESIPACQAWLSSASETGSYGISVKC